MVPDVAYAVKSWIPVCPWPVVITAPFCMKKLDLGHHMVWGTRGWALEDRLRRACATELQAIFKTVSVRLKLFPLRQSCGVVWIEQVAGCVAGLLAFSGCLSGWLAGWLVGSCGLASSSFWRAGLLDGRGSASSGWTFDWMLGCRLASWQALWIPVWLTDSLAAWLTGYYFWPFLLLCSKLMTLEHGHLAMTVREVC